jgi:outer membrane lipoprotein SlyB
MTQIVDGTGSGRRAHIDGNHRISVKSVNIRESEASTHLGDSYNLNTGIITLTNDTETPVMYVKNNEVADLHIIGTAYGFWTSTGGSPTDTQITVIRNPTAGTIVSTAANVAINSNRNYGSAKTLNVDAYVGATGDTLTDGTDHLIFYATSGSRIAPNIDEIISKGSSIALKIKPPAGNTSMDLYAAIVLYVEDLNE